MASTGTVLKRGLATGRTYSIEWCKGFLMGENNGPSEKPSSYEISACVRTQFASKKGCY